MTGDRARTATGRRRARLSTRFAGLAALAVLAPVSASAQDNAVDVPPVEVTARKQPQSPKPLPRPAARLKVVPVVHAIRPLVTPRPLAAPAPMPVRFVVARPAPLRSAQRRTARAAQGAPLAPIRREAAPLAPALAAPGSGERANGPVRGYVSTRSATGTKTDTPRIETPQSVSVIGRDQIETQKPQSLLEATRYTPGIVSQTFGNDTRNDFFLIRGFPAEQTGIFLNGLQLPSTAFGTFRLEPFGLERIEVLRGPASVLYGGTNPGGLVNAVSKRPTGVESKYVEFGINNFGNAYGAFDFNSATYTNQYGSFAARLTGLGKGGGTQTNFTDDDRFYIAPSLTWQLPDGKTDLTFLTSYQRDHTNGQNFLPYQGTVQRAPFGFISTNLFTSDPNLDTFDRDQILAGYELEHRFSDWLKIRQNFRYSNVSILDRTLFGGGYATPPTFLDADLSRFNFITTPRVDIFNVDNQAEVKFGTGPLAHTALLGIDYKRYRIADSQGFEFGPTLNLLDPVYSPIAPPSSRFRVLDEVQDQLGLYAQDQVKFDRFTLVVSGREDFVQTDIKDKLTPANSSLGNDSAFSGRVGLIYTSAIGLAPYASYSNSFVPQFGTLGSTSNPLKPETGQQYEAGIKYQPFENLGYASAAVFDLTRQNVVTTDPTNILLTNQTGEINSRGVELEAVANLPLGVKLVSAYTAYDIKTTKSLDPSTIGKLPTNTPDHIGAVSLDYTIQTGVLAGLGGGGGVRYTGRSYADPQNLFRVPGRVLGDLAVHFERAGWRAQVNFTNITDNTYVAGCSTTSACFYGERRTILGSLSHKW